MSQIPEIVLSGPPRERGRAHGEALRGLIGEAIDRWYHHLATTIDPDRVIREVAGDVGFLEAAQAYTPHLVEEVQGIAEGSGQRFETMFAWQLIDEVWWYIDELLGEVEPRERCSALAINHRGVGWVAQTQDLPRHLDGGQVLLRYRDEDGLEILAPSIAGLLALNGVNRQGFAACITTLSQLGHVTTGLSSGFIVPELLRCRSVEDALSFLGRVPIASGNSFLFGTATRSAGVEVSADGMTPVGTTDRVLHTNHALVMDPVFDYVRFAGSVERLGQLDADVRPDSSRAGLEAVYREFPICRVRESDDASISVGTMLFELGPDPLCHFAPGPLATDELATYRFETENR
jgi:hypothetical protein